MSVRIRGSADVISVTCGWVPQPHIRFSPLCLPHASRLLELPMLSWLPTARPHWTSALRGWESCPVVVSEARAVGGWWRA